MAAASAAALRATGANAADDDARRLFEQRFPVLFKTVHRSWNARDGEANDRAGTDVGV